MQYFLGIDQIEARGAAIGLPLLRLVRMAGLNASTAWRLKSRKFNPQLATLQKLTETLERQENKLRRHLKDLERTGGGRQMDLLETK